MTDNKRFNSYCDNENIRIRIDDDIKNKEVFHIYFAELDDALYCKSKLNPILDCMNELHEENESLKDVNAQCCNDYSAMRRDVLRYKEENEQLKQRNDRQAKRLAELYELMAKKDWKSLTEIIDDFCSCEEQLQREWRTYE